MTLFIINMVSVSMAAMAAVILIILRERTDNQLLMSAVALEALVALGALMWIEPEMLDIRFLGVRTIGRTIEAAIMWYVIITQVRGIQRAALNPTMTEVISKEIEDIRQQVAELKQRTTEEESANAATH